jgi:hypothetical protein
LNTLYFVYSGWEGFDDYNFVQMGFNKIYIGFFTMDIPISQQPWANPAEMSIVIWQ